tara:strand:- start:2685 stop:3242 length:558 start_codon:yes stop_codon:yes gene_type:complete
MWSQNYFAKPVLLLLCLVFSGTALAQDIQKQKEKRFRSTGYPLPRFVSLAKDKVYVRAGPTKKFPIKWVLQRKHLPVEIILEYETWRKIKDHEGQEGWVHHALLSGERTALVQGEDIVPIYKSVKNSEPLSEKDMVAYLKPFVLLSVEECENQWCYVKTLEKNTQFSGWIERKMIWGVYEDENFD